MKLVEWLASLVGISNIRPCKVTIDGVTWEGARYTRTSYYTADQDAVRWGKKKAGEAYTQEFIYCLGKLPKCYAKRVNDKGHAMLQGKVCFPYEGLDWYVCGYYQQDSQEFQEYHPCGRNFMLAPWDIPNSKIDDGEPKIYTRKELKVTYAATNS